MGAGSVTGPGGLPKGAPIVWLVPGGRGNPVRKSLSMQLPDDPAMSIDIRSRYLGFPWGAMLVAGLLASPVHALPMGSQGTWMVMGDFTRDNQELAANYAVTRRDAFGGAVGRWEEVLHAGAPYSHAQRRDFAAVTYTRQLNRWNLPDAQANLWLVGMAGAVRPRESRGQEAMGALALLADYETTRVYAGAGLKGMRASGSIRHDTAYARAGFSFYEVEYEETQPWLIVEAKRERYGAASKESWMPMLRFINRRYFLEVGGNQDGAMLNFMLVY